jgi:hypothetical protein
MEALGRSRERVATTKWAEPLTGGRVARSHSRKGRQG